MPIEIGIACVEQPSVRRINGNAGMSHGMAGQRDHQDLRRQSIEIAHRAEAEPALPGGVVETPVPHLVPLLWAVAAAMDEAVSHLGLLELRTQDMNSRVRKVLEAAGMVEIEMGQYDVAHVAG